MNENYVRDNLNQNYDGLVCEVVDKEGCLNPEEFIELDNPEKTGTCLAKVGFCIVDYPN